MNTSKINKMSIKNRVCATFADNGKHVTKEINTDKRTVSGLFASYNYADSYLDVLQPGCCAKSIEEKGPISNGGNKIKHLKDHDWSQVVARIDVLDERKVDFNFETIEGVYHESYYPDTPTSNDLLAKIAEGLYDARSIGFKYKALTFAEKDSEIPEATKAWEKYHPKVVNKDVVDNYGFFWVVSEIDLWEGSDVAFGANPQTPLLGIKSESNASLVKNYQFCKKILNTKEMCVSDYRKAYREVARFEAGNLKAKISEATRFMLNLK